MKNWIAIVVLACMILVVPYSYAQNVTGTISGVVRDPSGAVIPGATVVAVNTGTKATVQALTDATGRYAIQSIPVGVYDLKCEMPGFKTYEAREIRVQVNEVARVDVTTAIGSTTETVVVNSQVVAVDTSTATLKVVVDQQRIEDLPLNGRNATQLMRLVAGTQIDTKTSVTSGTTYPGAIGISVNGGRANTTNYVLDGGQNNDHYSNAANPMPNPDALQEFSVQTNNFSAEFGRQSGGVVNAVTRSGTNQLHGSAFEYIRNKAVNAAEFFAPILPDGSKRDDGLKRNQFGATLGGPIWLGPLYNGRDKTFFFFSYQGTRDHQTPIAVERIVPTEAQRNGDFSGLTKSLKNPFQGGTYTGNRIPDSNISPISKFILGFVPLPDPGKNTITVATPQNVRDDQIMVRADHQFTPTNKLNGRFWVSNASIPAFLNPKNYLAVVTGRTWRNTSVVLTDTQAFGTKMLNTTLFSFNRTNGGNVPIPPAKSLTDLGAKMWNDDPFKWQLSVSGYFSLDTNDTNFFLRDEYQVTDTLRWSLGKHQVAMGFEYGHGIGGITNNYRSSGSWTFSSSAPFTGDSLADFMVGKFSSVTQGLGEYKDTRFNIVNMFVQDSFRLTRRFNLDIGLRWEPFFPYTDLDGKLTVWRPGERSTRYQNAPAGILYPGDPGLPDGGYPTAWGNIGPRIGIAWDVFGDGKTSLRTGYGIFFDRPNTISTNSQANQAPFGTVAITNGNALNSFADPYAGAINPFPASQNPGPDVAFVLPVVAFSYDPDMRNGSLQSWNLTFEREIGWGVIARGAYAGSKGTHLVSVREANAPIYSPGATTATINKRRPLYPNFGQVSLVGGISNSTFHSGQFTAERRFNNGFSILANYTLAKSLDDTSENKVTGQNVVNPWNIGFDKGPSAFDHKHVFNLSSLWAVPVRTQNRVANFLVGGWNLNTIVSMMSGSPLTIASGVDNARTGTGSQRADLIGNPYLAEGRSRGELIRQYMNTAAFGPNALGTFGNQGRNMFRGPGYAAVDLGLHKSFRVTEQLTTQFRFEMFNAFNRVNLGDPNTSQNSSNFMKITSARDPRILQFALRLAW